jgi:biotin operon repressor
MFLVPALRKLRQEGYEVEASLGYRIRPCLKKMDYFKATVIMIL